MSQKLSIDAKIDEIHKAVISTSIRVTRIETILQAIGWTVGGLGVLGTIGAQLLTIFL